MTNGSKNENRLIAGKETIEKLLEVLRAYAGEIASEGGYADVQFDNPAGLSNALSDTARDIEEVTGIYANVDSFEQRNALLRYDKYMELIEFNLTNHVATHSIDPNVRFDFSTEQGIKVGYLADDIFDNAYLNSPVRGVRGL